MKTFVCVVFLFAAAVAAPEGKREKRGFLHSDFHHDFHSSHIPSFDLDHHYSHGPIISHAPIIESAHIVHRPSHKLVAVKKIVEVPKVVEIKKLVSIPKVITVPRIITSHKLVEDHSHGHYEYAPSISHGGWW